MEHSINPDTAQRFLNCGRFLKNEIFAKGDIDPEEWAKIIMRK
jgi:hypothetical protein